MPTYSITIRIRLTAPSEVAAETAVVDALDVGELQDAINAYSEACDEGDVHVTSCTMTGATLAYRRCEACGGPGPVLYDAQRYCCRSCHSNPDDAFFANHQDNA